MSQSKKFIITSDKSVSDMLIAHGFILLSQIGGTYTFKNDQGKLNFANIEKGKICYSNILSL